MVAEYFYAGGAGVMRIAWTRPDGVRETIPASAWRQVEGGANGLKAQYFHAVDLTGTWFVQVEQTLDHDFGSGGPVPVVVASPASTTLDVTLPAGTWAASWIDPETGRTIDTLVRPHAGGVASLTLPRWKDDLALDLRRVATP
jgi:hypothetical protein